MTRTEDRTLAAFAAQVGPEVFARIELLAAENAALRDGLEAVRDFAPPCSDASAEISRDGLWRDNFRDMQRRARAALREADGIVKQAKGAG